MKPDIIISITNNGLMNKIIVQT